jgi:L,D-peptidoglycan transpeptidase YkuD (ErfK/YbiS/YcfS/YnhG family)
MDLIVETPRSARWGDRAFPCAIGRGGAVPASAKREGDGKTPIGRWPMRQVFYRADRLALPVTKLPIRPLDIADGWCEVPTDSDYNKLVRLPHPGVTTERMWREDHLYDVVVALGHNDDPVVPGAGSAIFLHVIRPDLTPSSGCVTVRQEDLLIVLRESDNRSCVVVR